ncbi:MAG: hypothetical protein ACE5ES_01870, partial [Candidatus Nanoarchaeia archaeon]
ILSFGSETYSFAINKINLKKVAKVTVIPSIQDAGTTATFNYKIGIDKRLFTLSPEKAKKKIEALDKKIEKWEEISANLGGFVKGMKAACLATGAALTVKNLFTSTGGQALARQDVMNGPGGWYEKCAEAVEKGTLDGKSVNYASPEACLFDSTNSDAIDKQVESYAQDLIDVNDEISGFEDNLKGYNSRVAGNLIGVDVCSSVIGKDNSIDFGSFEAGVGLIDENKRFLSEEDTRDLDLWRRRLERDAKDKRALEEYCTRALEIDQRYSSIKRIEETEERLKNSGIIGARARHFRGKDAKEEIYDGAVVSDGGFGSIPTETRVQVIVFGSEEYIVSLKPLPGTSGEYRINKVYDDKGIELTDKDESTSNGNKIATATLIKNSYSVFKSFDESTYRNPYRNPEVRYYETRNAQGQPAIVPIDTKNGWYVATSNVFQASDGLRAFSSSGRVESFWLCNVGENGLEQNRRPDDICQGINLAIGETYSQFHGLSRSEVKSLVDKGVRAIAEAERAHRSGIKKVRILGRELNVGSPAVDIPDAQCTDFMSPKDCKLLFNVCDPVICPSSRCDFGGSYPVKDVVQSGIVGSIALCLPNFQEGIVVPVCLTGIQSGIDSWNAVQKEYRSCLQDSVDTGQLTGICDEVYSIRACEFFWRQAFPLAKLAVPKLISFATGENVRGGGEYALVQSAWDNTEASVNYFTNYYAANSFKAFKARSADEFGGEICRNFVSGIVPSGNFFDALVEPDSPPQFHGRFDENTFTTATNPPTSQYKVFYFIYAGKDSRAFYQVYLKGDPSSSYYQDVGFRRVVASGFIPRGEQISETRDFIAPSGYREMCINVNGQEECGFQEVSTSFAVNYIKDQYLAEQAIDKVTTEEQCVAGSSSAFTLLNPNIQSGIEQTITPELYKRGIVRICATKDPGVGTDNKAGVINESRWADVGYCGDRNLRCWLDTDSVKEVIKDLDTEGKALSEVNARFQDRLRQSGEYLDGEDVTAALDKLEDIDKKLRDRTNRMSTQERKELSADINTVNSIINKLFFSHHRAFAHFVRGEVYGWLAREGRPDVDKKPTAQGESRDEESGAETPLADNCSEFNGFPDICESYQNCLWNSESNICEERPIITNEDDESQFNEDIASAEDSGADIISGTDFIYDDEEQVIAEDIYETISLPKLTQSGTVSLNVEYDEEKCDSLRYELKREVVFGAFDWTIREGSFKGDIEFGGAFFKEGVKYHAEVICIKDGKKIDEPRFSNEIVYGDQ